MNYYTGATCRSCGAPIIWTKTEAGKAMPVDRDPVESGGNGNIGKPGNLFLEKVGHAWGDSRQRISSRVVMADVEPERQRYVSHFATCPNAKEHRQ